jgi:hypothetical protein
MKTLQLCISTMKQVATIKIDKKTTIKKEYSKKIEKISALFAENPLHQKDFR